MIAIDDCRALPFTRRDPNPDPPALMIESIRKFRGLLLLGLALVVLGLILGLKEDLFRGGIGGQSVYRIDGRTYSDREFTRLGANSLELVYGLARSGDYDLFSFLGNLTPDADNQDKASESFFVHRMLLRNKARELGVQPDDAAITEKIKSMRAFSKPDPNSRFGQQTPPDFSEEIYRNFIDKGIGRLGLTEADLRDLVADYLSYEKMSDMIGAGLEENRAALAADIALDRQQISSVMIKLDIAKHRDAIQPTDEDLKAYWDEKIAPFLEPLPKNADGSDDDSAIGASEKEVRATYTTEPLRTFSYVLVTPEAAVAPEESADETNADTAATEEDKKRIEEEKQKAKEERAKKFAEEKRNKQREADSKVDEFATQLEERKGEGFEELAQQNGWTVVTTEPFKRSAPPAGLDLKLRASGNSPEAPVVDELFRIAPTADPLSKISQPIPVGKGQWLVARLDSEESARPKTFDESKDKVREQYIREKSIEALEKEAEELKQKLEAAINAGKSFDTATSEAGINRTHSVLGYDQRHNRDEEVDRLDREIADLEKQIAEKEAALAQDQPDEAASTDLETAKKQIEENRQQRTNANDARNMVPRSLFEKTRNVNPGKLADIVYEPTDNPTAAHLIQVTKREVLKTNIADNLVNRTVSESGQANARLAFKEWLTALREKADVVSLFQP
jgi:hypothetical protein